MCYIWHIDGLQGELEELELVSWEEKLMIERKQTESLESQMNRLRDQLKEREELKQDRQKEAENLGESKRGWWSGPVKTRLKTWAGQNENNNLGGS